MDSSKPWTAETAAGLYGFDAWAKRFFGVGTDGSLRVLVPQPDGSSAPGPSFSEIIREIREKGVHPPALVRFPHLLAHRVVWLTECFAEAIARHDYPKPYRGGFPIKVNQQRPTIVEILEAGRPYHYGLEVGSKAELAAAMSLLDDPEAYLMCNARKDPNYLKQILLGTTLGSQIVVVIESPAEALMIARALCKTDIRPILGVRVRLRSKVPGSWAKTSGEHSFFGLDASELIEVIEILRGEKLLGSLGALHFHQASQIPKLESIRASVREASRFYVELVKEGAPMGILDVGGGLAVDYDASKSSAYNSKDYTVVDYADIVVGEIFKVMRESGVEPPVIISESGRAIVAPMAALIVPIVETAAVIPSHPDDETVNGSSILRELSALFHGLKDENLARTLNSARARLDQARADFADGRFTLRQLNAAEAFFGAIARQALEKAESLEDPPPEALEIESLAVDFYYGSFSVFQSTPDLWGIESQVFPVAPVHRLDERPTRNGVIVDLTCDSDGAIDQFGSRRGHRHHLELHELRDGEPYYVGVFMLGAYQETLGDYHNLYGIPHIVNVRIDEAGGSSIEVTRPGDGLADVLTVVGYSEEDLVSGFQKIVESRLGDGASAGEIEETVEEFRASFKDYTYFRVDIDA